MRLKLLIYPLLLVISLLLSANHCMAGSVEVVKHLFTIKMPPSDPLKHPSDVTVSDDGQIYVLDGVNNRVVVFNRKGKFQFSFGSGGSGDGEFNMPLGLSLDKNGKLYIADSGNGRVQVFSAKGEYLEQIPLPTDVQKKPDPTDTAVDRKKNLLYIVDNENHILYTYSLKKKRFTKAVGEMGLGKTKSDLRWPFTLEVDKEGNVLIVDVINTRVRVMNREGRFMIDIGEWGVDRGQVFRPKGVAVDSKGRVYISDSFTGIIQIFDIEGNFINVLGDKKGGVKKFTTPIRVFVDKKDRIYVVEMFAHRVSVYKSK